MHRYETFLALIMREMRTFDIKPLDRSLLPELQDKIDNLTKPKGSLGTLEELRHDVLSDTVLKIRAEKMPAILPFRKSGENQYELDIHSDSEIPHLVRQIVEGGGDVYDVTAQKPSLEDIYFALTAKGKGEAM